MFVGITNTPRDYAWGSTTAIAGLLGYPPTGHPEAELWLGTHPGSPSVVLEPDKLGGATTLDKATTLPFLLKILAAASPLSLQAHPTLAQAIEGFARENAEGIPLDAPFRNYKDALHKPELIYALSDEYHALCGFREVSATRQLLEALGDDSLVSDLLSRLADNSSLPAVFDWLISRGSGVDALVARIVQLSAGRLELEFQTVADLSAAYPGDPGIVISLLLNRVVLAPGEVLYLPAGNIHAYLAGLGIELMAASDNVLRGGLTPKYIDIPELLHVLDFTPVAVPYLVPERPAQGVEIFRPDVPDFVLTVVDIGHEEIVIDVTGECILLSLSSGATVAGSDSTATMAMGTSMYVRDESRLTFSGSGTVFMATAGNRN
ncbi:mannose-6-phosphate isomerase, class I [Glaciihabitans sp. dw_435]|uniref:mannose-6-phosphate isomerase, class I n=1 Tax=Glaciihabitans sp. dw_435 TaxID=2720081 RepID=UPI001BD647F1|nr:mannose-6-phosphate isomerase, class I [Glaciihabitans sp. dw_435]